MKCDKCGHKIKPYPSKNVDGTRNWKNTIIGDPILTWIAISIIIAVFGVAQFTEDCTYIKENPGEYCNQWCDVRPQYYEDDKGFILPNNETFNFTIT